MDEHSRVYEIEEFSAVLWHGGFSSHSLRGSGAGRSKYFGMFSLLVDDKIFRQRRRR
jgi:hypothetical protein